MPKFEVTAPDEKFNGQVGGVRFADGKATVDSADNFAALSYFANTPGYGVTKAAAKTKTTKADGDKPKD